MANKMLIDAAHPEETRVVVLRGNRVEEFDFESASRKQLRGNIYLAKVTRVEPSLQAAFVDYGGNRHGFLAFSEIHPDYYQIPIADRQALIEAEEREAREADARAAAEDKASADDEDEADEPAEKEDDEADDEEASAGESDGRPAEAIAADSAEGASVSEPAIEAVAETVNAEDETFNAEDEKAAAEPADSTTPTAETVATSDEPAASSTPIETAEAAPAEPVGGDTEEVVSDQSVESIGAEDALEELPERRKAARPRQYKIQEVIKRRQVLLVQVVKEERGNKGAALTTYLSLAGRYSVLMPNTARGGGISRKITSPADRKRLKKVATDLEVPEGMGVILRTAGASRTKAEVKRDFEYLLRLWENVRELTLRSTAPTLVYEEGSLIKRSIRDLYNKEIDEILVAGDDSYREAKDFMRMLMPSHAKNVKPYKEGQPLFVKAGIEAQLDAMFSPQVTLRSGGYIVINQTEALVSIDVNSGRATREHNIEDTAHQTNLEAAEEVARQLRLRDLAGLIVIDFIDMEEKRNNRSVERKLKDALKNDRARIQVGRISHFGLLEMSRQRIRTGVLESTTSTCPVCHGTGHIRAPSSVALHVLRSLEDQLLKGVTHNLTIRTRTPVALYILNQKRPHLFELENRFGLTIAVMADETITNGSHFAVDRGEPVMPRETVTTTVQPDSVQPALEPEDEIEVEFEEETEDDDAPIGSVESVEDEDDDEPRGDHRHEGQRDEDGGRDENGQRKRRRRRRRRGGEGREGGREGQPIAARPNEGPRPSGSGQRDAEGDGNGHRQPQHAVELDENGQPRKRRRGRRGGRRGRGRGGEDRPQGENRQQNGGGQHHEREPRFADQPQPRAPFADLTDPIEIDTTPQPYEPVRRAEPAERSEPQQDSVPIYRSEPIPPPREEHRPEPQFARDERPAAETQASEPEPVAPPAPPAARPVEVDDPNRPKRGGWWQRRSFF
jgi:ribonuclease E